LPFDKPVLVICKAEKILAVVSLWYQSKKITMENIPPLYQHIFRADYFIHCLSFLQSNQQFENPFIPGFWLANHPKHRIHELLLY